MNLLERLTLAGQSLRHTIPLMVRPAAWVWVLPLAAAQLLALLLAAMALHPAVSGFMAPLLVALGGPDALHYPRTFELLPAIFARMDAALGVVLGAIGIGAATPVFADCFRGERPQPLRALGDAFRRAPHLVVALLPLQLGAFLLTSLGAGAGGGLRGRLAGIALAGLAIALQSAMFYAAARVMLEGRPAGSALASLPATWRPGFVPAFFVGVVTLVVLIPLHLPGITPRLLIERGTPELSVVLAFARAASGWINAFLLTGAATLLYLGAVRPAERE